MPQLYTPHKIPEEFYDWLSKKIQTILKEKRWVLIMISGLVVWDMNISKLNDNGQ